ncbi:MAG: FtsW/RodA/SpoVE family cell cycle protein, partial [Armatimonadota bacterium]
LLAAFLLGGGRQTRDRLLLPFVSMLCAIGLVILWRIDLALGTALAAKQVLWMLVGLAAMVVTYRGIADIRDLARYKYTAGAVALFLLIVTIVSSLGHESHGATLWLKIPYLLAFQPAELAKVLMCIFLAGYVAEKGDIIRAQAASRPGAFLPALKYMGPLLVVVVFFLAVFVLQRDLGAAVLFFGLFVAVTYLATGRKTYALLSVILFAVGMVAAVYLFSHVRTRFEAWINPWGDPTRGGYQILQGLFALGSGGVTGVGLGQGFPGQIPTPSTDMIYAVIGEEMGLLGTLAVILLYALIAVRSFTLGIRSTHPFGALLATCLAVVFGLQTLIIVGGVLRMIPMTGITMPFVSYGGTSVVVNFVALGLLLAVARDSGKIPEE